VISECACACVLTAAVLTAVVHAHKSGQPKKQIRPYTLVKHTYDCSHLACCISIDVQTIYTLSPTRARDSVNSHVTHKHSPKRCKPGKYAGWKDRQLVVDERKCGRREETVRHTLHAITVPWRVRQCERTRDKCVDNLTPHEAT
jgi:hypothetical protein